LRCILAPAEISAPPTSPRSPPLRINWASARGARTGMGLHTSEFFLCRRLKRVADRLALEVRPQGQCRVPLQGSRRRTTQDQDHAPQLFFPSAPDLTPRMRTSRPWASTSPIRTPPSRVSRSATTTWRAARANPKTFRIWSLQKRKEKTLHAQEQVWAMALNSPALGEVQRRLVRGGDCRTREQPGLLGRLLSASTAPRWLSLVSLGEALN